MGQTQRSWMRFPPHCVAGGIQAWNRPCTTIPCASCIVVCLLSTTSQNLAKRCLIQLSSFHTPGKERAHQNQPYDLSQRIPIVLCSGCICECARAARGMHVRNLRSLALPVLDCGFVDSWVVAPGDERRQRSNISKRPCRHSGLHRPSFCL